MYIRIGLHNDNYIECVMHVMGLFNKKKYSSTIIAFCYEM